MTEDQPFNYELERLDCEVRFGYSLLYEASQLRGYIDGLVGAVAVREKGGLLKPKSRQKADQDLKAFLAAKKREGIAGDEESVVLGSRINNKTRQVEEIRVNQWDFGQIRSLFNRRNILNAALEVFDRYLNDFEENPTQANRAAQKQSLILIGNAIDGLYQPKVIKEGSKDDKV